MLKKIKYYVIGILIPVAIGGLSALLTRGDMDIYKDVAMPPFAPPAILFPIAWSILYVLMSVSSVMVLLEKSVPFSDKAKAFLYYFLSLCVNFLWNIIFFKLRAFFACFILILILLFLIIKTIIEYIKINKIAAYLQIPYALWVTFAAILNFSVWYLNR